MGCCRNQGQGSGLVAMAAALSSIIAQGRTAEELELLASLFEIIADNLALLALQTPSGDCCCCKSQEQASAPLCAPE